MQNSADNLLVASDLPEQGNESCHAKVPAVKQD